MSSDNHRLSSAFVAILFSFFALLCTSSCTESEAIDNTVYAENATPLDAPVPKDYTKTQYPIVLAHGMVGFDRLALVVDYWYGIAKTLSQGGAEVFITETSAFNSAEVRGEQLLKQIEVITAKTGKSKVNIIGHSQGGMDARYVAAVRPDLVASITTVGTPHQGSEFADFLRVVVPRNSRRNQIIGFLGNVLGKCWDILAGKLTPQDSMATLDALSSVGSNAFNQKYPKGLPTSACGEGPASLDGIYYYSWGGTRPATRLVDPLDYALKLTSFTFRNPNDGLVQRCSSHFGKVLKDDYQHNHLDLVNMLFGIVDKTETKPTTVYRTHANRLKIAGL